MNYRVSKIRRAGKGWRADVLYWEGECSCTGETKEVDVIQDNRPKNAVFIEAFKGGQ